MKKLQIFVLGIGVVGAVVLALYWLHINKPHARKTDTNTVSPDLTSSATAAAQPQSKVSAAAPTPKQEAALPQRPIERFDLWAQRYSSADSAKRASLEPEGEALAKQRREEMFELIKSDPQQAIKRALTYSQRKKLPPEILRYVEEPITARGEFQVLGAVPLDASSKVQPIQRRAIVDGREYEAYTYGRGDHRISGKNVPMSGLAIDGRIALNENPVRVLEEEEKSDVLASGAVQPEAVCSVSGENWTKYSEQTLVQVGRQYLPMCHKIHADQYGEWLMAAEAKITTHISATGEDGYPTNPPPELKVNHTQGRFTLLFIRLRFQDDPIEPISETAAYRMMNDVNRFFVESSYDTASIISTVSPLITLPQTKDWYSAFGVFILAAHAHQECRKAGFDPLDYDLDILAHRSVPGFDWGGLAYVGSRGVWLQSITAGVACHELGHNFGLFHANYLETRNEPRPSVPYPPNPNRPNPNYPIDSDSWVGHDGINEPGRDIEYGDPFDTMGTAAGGVSQFNSTKKAALHWLPSTYIRTLKASETNRLYAYDSPNLTAGRVYALRFRKDAEREYWAAFRERFTANDWLVNGLEIHFGPWAGTAGSAQILDTTPGSANGKIDCPVVIGRTFSDWQGNIHLTPVAKGGEGLDQWIDVVFQKGPFPANVPPGLSLSASDLVVTNGATVTFTATATDGDGDKLAYHWEYSDGTFGSNAPVVARTFATDGKYVVRCEVSDMKGGVTSAYVVVTVGTPSTYLLSGQVIDTYGNPVANMKVHNGMLGNAYRYAFTDSQGYYTIADVPSGSYTNKAFLFGYKTDPLAFFNPATINGDAINLDHLAFPIPAVSIALGEDGSESGGDPSFYISRTGDTAADLPVYFAVSGNAVSGVDYDSAATNVVVIPAGESGTFLSFPVRDDALSDGARTLTVTLHLQTNDLRIITLVTNNGSNTIFYTQTNSVVFPGYELIRENNQLIWYQTYPVYVLGTSQASAKIYDNEAPAPPKVSLLVVDDGAVESGRDRAEISFIRDGNLDEELVVSYSLGGVAVNGGDYARLSGTITIPAEESIAVLSITAIDDLFVEGNEELTVRIEPRPEYVVGGGSPAKVYVVDDDLPLVTVNASDAIADEPNQNPGRFTITRSGDLTAPLQVNYLLSGTAANGVDYDLLPTSVVIPAGEISVAVTVTPRIDNTPEGNETVILLLSDSTTYNIGTPNSGTVIIQDESLPVITLDTPDADAQEPGNPGQFTVTRSGPTNSSLTVTFDVSGSAIPQADYASIGTNIVIPAGVTSVSIFVNPIDDNFRETNDTVIVKLLPGSSYNLGNNISGTVVILNNDDSNLPEVSFAMRSLSVLESDGVAVIPVKLSAPIANTNVEPVYVEWRIVGGSATRDVDYSLVSTGYAVFRFQGLLMTNILVQINDDSTPEPTETLLISLFHPTLILTNAVVDTNGMTNFTYRAAPTNANLGSFRTFTLNIVDDDLSVVSIAATSPYAYEAGRVPGIITISREGSTNNAQTVRLAIAGTASMRNDYDPIGTTIVIPPGARSITIPIVPADDPEEETVETVDVSIVAAPGATIGNDFAEIFIVDNDGTIQFASPTVTAREGSGTAQVNVVRSGDTNLAVSVEYLVFPGTATLGRDYAANNGVLTFAPGQRTRSIPVSLLNDNAVEPDETVLLVLTNASGGVPLGGQTACTLIIEDDDTSYEFATPSFAASESSGNARISISRRGLSDFQSSVTFETEGLTATNSQDFTAATNTIVFAVGETNRIVNVPILDDFAFEGDETVQLRLRNPSAGTFLGAVSEAKLTILDDECSVGFASANFQTNEYAPYATLIVTRSGGTANSFTVDFATQDGTAANPLDYAAASGTLTFAGDQFIPTSDGSGQVIFQRGETNKVIPIALHDDVLGEGNETFRVILSNARTIGAPQRSLVLGGANPTNATVTILDNETAGNVDYEYDPGAGANGRVLAMALQIPDMRPVFGGEFTSVGGITYNHIARLQPGGTVDFSFNPGLGADGDISAIATQTDGKILIGGSFSTFAGNSRIRVARLNANGSLDTAFNPGSGPNNLVRAIAVQSNGRTVLGGDFTQVGGSFRSRLARLNVDGSVESGFGPSVNGSVNSVAIQSDGRILIGGTFNVVSGALRNGIARLNSNGTLDTSFDPGTGANGAVNTVAVQADGKILIGGGFTGINGFTRNRIARLNPDGSLDITFNPGAGANGNVNALAIGTSGRVVVAGDFTTMDNIPRGRFARLKATGALDLVFDPGTGADGAVRTLGLQSDSAIVIGGDFTYVNGLPRNHIARIHGDERSNIVGVELANANISVIENAGPAAITVLRAGNTNVSFTVQLLATNTGGPFAPTPGLDYVATNVTLNFGPGEVSKTLNLRILDDTQVESDEVISITLTNGSSNVDLSGVTAGTVTIVDNEQSLRFATNQLTAAEQDGVANITVFRDGLRSGSVSVEFRALAETATSPGDFIATNRVLTFTNGEASKLVQLVLTDDRQEEPTETVRLVLTNSVGAFLGNPATATLSITDNDVTFGGFDFASTNRISIVDGAPAIPYPSTINITGLSGVVGRVEVTLSNLNHTFPDDIDVLLVAPNGASAILMSDAGGSSDAVNLVLRFSDMVDSFLPNSTQLSNGVFHPTDYEPGDVFAAPAPAGPFSATVSPLNGGTPNGAWRLFVMDDRGSDVGEISNGWILHLTTVNPGTVTDVAIGIIDSPDPIQAGQTLTYTIPITNLGPLVATGLKLTDVLPTDVNFLSVNTTQGACEQTNGVVFCDLGGIDVNSIAQVTISVMPLSGGILTNTASIQLDQADITTANSTATAVTTVTAAPVADLVAAISDAPDPIFAGQTLTYSIAITNRGPLAATGVSLNDSLPKDVSFVSALTSQGVCNAANGQVSCGLGSLGVNGSAQVSISIRPLRAGKLDNTVTLHADQPDLTPAEVSAQTTVYPAADLSVYQLESQDPMPLGGVLTYTVVVTNNGPNIANGVNIIDTLPNNAPFLSVLASQGSCYAIGSFLICDLGIISTGSFATVSIDLKPDNVGMVVNSARVIAGDFDGVQANNVSDESTAVSSFGSGIVITPNTNAVELAAAVTAGGSTGIRVTSARLSANRVGNISSSGTFRVGTPPYTYNLTQPGIVLSSGNVKDYETGPNNSTGNTFSFGAPATPLQEQLLDPITGVGTNNFRHFDVTQLDLVFDLLPGFNQVQFKIVFGSEEYKEFVGSSFVDGFGLYLNGVNIAYTRGAPININHPDMRALPGTELDGVLAPDGDPILTFSAPLVPNSRNNTLTIIVADTSDTALDTTVYVSSLQGAPAPNADMAASITAAPEPVFVGDILNYQLVALNRGPEIATNAFIQDRLPLNAQLQTISVSQGGVILTNGVLFCSLGNLPRGSNAIVNLTVRTLSDGRLTNTIVVGSDLADLRDTNNTASLVSTVIEPGALFNTTPIVLSDGAPCLPYPSIIHVEGVNGVVGRVTVTLSELSHSFPADLDVLLVSPSGVGALLMSDVGEGFDINSVTLRLDDNAPSPIPAGELRSGRYQPTNIGGGDTFLPPAPSGPYAESLSIFNGTDPNGDWALYVMDDQGADSGVLAGGWRLVIQTGPQVPGPELLISYEGSAVAISWPDPSPGYVLETTDRIGASATWTSVPDVPVSSLGRVRVNLPVGAGNHYFRLRKGSP